MVVRRVRVQRLALVSEIQTLNKQGDVMVVNVSDLIGIGILLVSSMLVLTLSLRRVYVLEQRLRYMYKKHGY